MFSLRCTLGIHKWGDWSDPSKSACERKRVCTLCGTTDYGGIGHDWSEWGYDEDGCNRTKSCNRCPARQHQHWDMNRQITIEWRGNRVGTLVYAQFDMWYLEGDFSPTDGEASAQFVAFASALDADKVMQKPERGTRVTLYEGKGDTNGSDALVLSLNNGVLFVRQVFDRRAVAWLRSHVK